MSPNPEAHQPHEALKAIKQAFITVAEKAGEVGDSEKYSLLSKAGAELRAENTDSAQRTLERADKWDDETRGLAVSANQLERQQEGKQPMSLEQALRRLDAHAADLDPAKDAEQIATTRAAAQNPRIEQTDPNALNGSLGVVEGYLRVLDQNIRERHYDTTDADALRALESEQKEYRAMRDALFAEKQSRVEKAGKAERQLVATEQTKQIVRQQLAELEEQTAVSLSPDLLRRIGRMNPEETRYLQDEIQEIREVPDVSEKRERLQELTIKDFSSEAVHDRAQIEANAKADAARRTIESSKSVKTESYHFLVPELANEDEWKTINRELAIQYKQEFERFGESHGDKTIGPNTLVDYRGYIQKVMELRIRDLELHEKTTGEHLTSADTVASVLIQDATPAYMLGQFEGMNRSTESVLRMKFSDFATAIGLKLPDQFTSYFHS